jgi:hypothetical protein
MVPLCLDCIFRFQRHIGRCVRPVGDVRDMGTSPVRGGHGVRGRRPFRTVDVAVVAVLFWTDRSSACDPSLGAGHRCPIVCWFGGRRFSDDRHWSVRAVVGLTDRGHRCPIASDWPHKLNEFGFSSFSAVSGRTSISDRLASFSDFRTELRFGC